MRKICVIGGGASGMTAAIAAARQGAAVTILEHKDRLGKKLLSTGNGRCNLTNEAMSPDYFRGEAREIIPCVLDEFGVADTLRFFEELGVLFKKRDGYVYPRSDQAGTILEVLLLELRRLGVTIKTNTHVARVEPGRKGFRVYTEDKKVAATADRVILACGGKAASVLGSDGSGYAIAKSLGHTIAPVVPALVQLKARGSFFKSVSGVRTEAKVMILIDGQPAASDTGELQLTNYGISGIPVFQVSRYAAMALYEKREVTAVLDFIPGIAEPAFEELLSKRLLRQGDDTAEDFLIGIFHKKLIPVFLEKAGIQRRQKAGELTDDALKKLVTLCKHFSVPVYDTNSFDQAQVCAGGVRTTEVKKKTMESIYTEGLYITGELLDIEGICGGYNLQWAWATGYLAGKAAAVGTLHSYVL